MRQEDTLEKVVATQSSILAWKIPLTEEPDGLHSRGSQSRTRLNTHTHTHKLIFCNSVMPFALSQLGNHIWKITVKETQIINRKKKNTCLSIIIKEIAVETTGFKSSHIWLKRLFIIFFFLAMPCGMWDLRGSKLCTLQWKHRFLTLDFQESQDY